MVLPAVQRAKRALVLVLQALAVAYGLSLHVSREASDEQVATAFRKTVRRVHPDKGGSLDDSQRLHAAR